MKRDFTIQTYVKLLDALHNSGYTFQRFDEFLLDQIPGLLFYDMM